MDQTYLCKPYEFVKASRGTFWCHIAKPFYWSFLRRAYGVDRVEVRGMEHFHASLQRGAGIVLAPNHCRYADPAVMGAVAKLSGTLVYFCASWHLFEQSRLQRFLITRLGGMSIYREGTDRDFIREITRILEAAERPIVLFPEGTFFRTNDRLGPLQDGVSFMARRAAKKGVRPVVIHPVAIKFWFTEDPRAAIERRLCAFEQKCHMHPKRGKDFVERLKWVGAALLTVKEMEILGSPQSGSLDERRLKLADHLCRQFEQKYIRRPKGGTLMDRIRLLRSIIVRQFAQDQPESSDWYEHLYEIEDLAFAQQLVSHAWDYLEEWPCLERIGETLQRFEEDLYDKEDPLAKMGAIIEISEAIDVADFPDGRESTENGTNSALDPITQELSLRIQGMLDRLVAAGPPATWNSPTGPGPSPAPREFVPPAPAIQHSTAS